MKVQVANDLPTHNQFIDPANLKSQSWLNEINLWTKNQKMMINEQKTKTMIINYTDKYQFTTRLKINNAPVEVINSTKLLGTIITDELKWDQNTNYIVRKANARIELLRRVASFGASKEDLKTIYILFVRSQLEQNSVVWHSSITEENKCDLEIVQKSAVTIIKGDQHQGYKNL